MKSFEEIMQLNINDENLIRFNLTNLIYLCILVPKSGEKCQEYTFTLKSIY